MKSADRRGAIYLRISDDAEGSGLGVTRQLADCQALAASLGWDAVTPDRIYVDNDLTAYAPPGKLPARPDYARLVEDIQDNKVHALIAWHTDRVHRTPMELEDYIVVADRHDVELRTVRAGHIDLSTPAGRAIARTMCAWARYESEHKSERIARKHPEIADAGKDHGGGTRPFGYEPDRKTIREDEAVEVRRMFVNLLAGWSVNAIVNDLNARRVPTVGGAVWRGVTVKRLRMGARVAGLREHQRGKCGLGANVVAEASWPAIVDRETWEAARGLLARRDGRVHRTPRRYLLSGLVRCGREECGKKLISRPTTGGKRGMVCVTGDPHHGCGKIRVEAAPLEDMVRDYTLGRLENEQFLRAISARSEDAAPLLAAIERDQDRLAALADAFGDDVEANPLEYRLAAGRIRERLEANRAKVARVQSQRVVVAVNPATVRAEWPGMDISQQRALVDIAVRDVIVSPAVPGLNRFDPGRVWIG
jgi:site-specific DNA recombinase